MFIYLLLMMMMMMMMFHGVGSQRTDFYGAVVTHVPGQVNRDGKVMVVDFHFKGTSRLCSNFNYWTCSSSDCGNASSIGMSVSHNESSGEWCHMEGKMTWGGIDSVTFQLELSNATWIENVNGIKNQKVVTLVDVRTRSDTGQANRSPQTTTLPALRVPSNCQRDFQLLAFDPDGDQVKCRYGNALLLECNPCTPPSVLKLSTSCLLSFSPTSRRNEGPYAVQLMMEDFPLNNIALSQPLESETVTPNNAISKIPVQFVLRVDPEVPSCTEGLFLPKFLPPTPVHGARLSTHVNQPLEIRINARANMSLISELLRSGPSSLNQTMVGPGEFMVRWTPHEGQGGEIHPICFVVQALLNGTKYHSEQRCVIVTVAEDSPFPPEITDVQQYILGLRVRISTPFPVTDKEIAALMPEVEAVLKAKAEAYGVPLHHFLAIFRGRV